MMPARTPQMTRPPTEAASVRGLALNTADECRDKAEECRQQAERAISPKDRAAWLRLAESWLNMAQDVDKFPPKREQ
jgi:hypothetical protein